MGQGDFVFVLSLADGERISMLLKGLAAILQKPARPVPATAHGTELSEALRTMQRLMCRDEIGQQSTQIAQMEQRVSANEAEAEAWRATAA